MTAWSEAVTRAIAAACVTQSSRYARCSRICASSGGMSLHDDVTRCRYRYSVPTEAASPGSKGTAQRREAMLRDATCADCGAAKVRLRVLLSTSPTRPPERLSAWRPPEHLSSRGSLTLLTSPRVAGGVDLGEPRRGHLPRVRGLPPRDGHARLQGIAWHSIGIAWDCIAWHSMAWHGSMS